MSEKNLNWLKSIWYVIVLASVAGVLYATLQVNPFFVFLVFPLAWVFYKWQKNPAFLTWLTFGVPIMYFFSYYLLLLFPFARKLFCSANPSLLMQAMGCWPKYLHRNIIIYEESWLVHWFLIAGCVVFFYSLLCLWRKQLFINQDKKDGLAKEALRCISVIAAVLVALLVIAFNYCGCEKDVSIKEICIGFSKILILFSVMAGYLYLWKATLHMWDSAEGFKESGVKAAICVLKAAILIGVALVLLFYSAVGINILFSEPPVPSVDGANVIPQE